MKRKFGSTKKIAAIMLISTSSLIGAHIPSFAQSDNAIVNEPDAANDLRDAIRRIGVSPTDSDALYDAGSASLQLGDAIVALDFFERAERLAPASGKIKAGKARAHLNLENPIEALRLFDVAIARGVRPRDIALDRGLAFDLVGNFERAQQEYSLAKRYNISNSLIIRQAISYSLAGDINTADTLLLPLLKENDPLAWRARSFLLAARGKLKEAHTISLGFLSPAAADNLRPYFKSMDKLTRAQQAAAVHFGNFPDSKTIGKDSEDIRIASANTAKALPESADRLVPAGKPLGRNISQKSDEAKLAKPKKIKKEKPSKKTPAKSIKVAEEKPVKLAEKIDILPKAAENDIKVAKAAQTANETGPKFTALASPAKDIATVLPEDGAAAIENKTAEVDASALQTEQSDGATFADAAIIEKKELDLGDFIASIEVVDENQTTVAAVDLDAIKAEQAAERKAAKLEADKRRAEKAQADKKEAERKEAVAKKQAEEAKKAEAKKAEAEKNKARYWVQLATGRDTDALKFDYRRISRKQSELFKGKSAATSKWGSTNRLVVGPFENLEEAKAFESQFRKGGGDGFVWRSGNGTLVTSIE